MESSCDVGGSKYPWPAVNEKMQSSQVGLLPRRHRVIKLDDYLRIKITTRRHEQLQVVSLHEEHGVSELWVIEKCWEIVVNLPVQVSPIVACIPRDEAAMEIRSLDNGCRGSGAPAMP